MLPEARAQNGKGSTGRWRVGGKKNRRLRGSVALRPAGPGIFARLGGALRRRLRLLLLFAIAGALSGGAYAAQRCVLSSSHFALRAIHFSPTRHVSAESLMARASVQLGANLFSVDLDELARELQREPWVASARARRELPATIAVDLVERQAACVVALGPLYLADPAGAIFKRATPEESAALPVVTGLSRDAYLAENERVKGAIREALSAFDEWRKRPSRPALGELHSDGALGVTLYTSSGGVGVRIGRVCLEKGDSCDESLTERLQRYDIVSTALKKTGERPQMIYLDNRARPDRVTVKLAMSPEREHREKNAAVSDSAPRKSNEGKQRAAPHRDADVAAAVSPEI